MILKQLTYAFLMMLVSLHKVGMAKMAGARHVTSSRRSSLNDGQKSWSPTTDYMTPAERKHAERCYSYQGRTDRWWYT